MMRPAIRLVLPVLMLAATTHAQEPASRSPVKLSITSLVARARSQAPQMIEVSLNNSLNQLLEGELELKFYVGRRLVGEYQSDTLVLSGDTQRFRIMLPPITKHYDATAVNIVGRWLVNGQPQFDLGGGLDGEHDLVVPAYWRRWFVIGISRPELARQSREGQAMESSLAFERFNPNMVDRLELTTYPTPIPPRSFPTTAVGYMGFDLLLLEADGFTDLQEAQLSAIATWVEAGGSVLVRPTGPMKPTHIGFLNRLTAGQPQRAPYLLDEQRRLDVNSAAMSEPFVRCHCDLGRAVIVHRPLRPEEDFTTPEWVETSLFLWKYRVDQAEAVRYLGRWSYQHPNFKGDWRAPHPFAPQEESPAPRLRELLLPTKVQGIPFWVVVTILSLFLLAIAPGDYYLLGLLRARRYTWLLLTGLSLAFTIGTIQIAERVMGNTDYRTSLVVIDLGREANPVRSSRFELLFTATQKLLETHRQNELYVSIDDRIPHFLAERSARGYFVAPITAEDEQSPPVGLAADLPVYVGRVPSSYVVRQQMRQWSPLVSRRTAFAEPVDVPQLDWARLDPNSWRDADEGRERLREEIAKAAPDAWVLLFHATRFVELTNELRAAPDEAGVASPNDTGLAKLFGPAPVVDESQGNESGGRYSNNSYADAALKAAGVDADGDLLQAVVKRVSTRPARGLFGVVSRVGPTAADTFEDLPLLDSSNPRAWLLVIVVRRDQDQFVFRKLYGEDQ
ncbi:MAG: hypothetical protein EXS05_14515 [Planctomycetaceae bacterium]|nr:hypothetical protein [Planctomycetaceae bacterium]